MTYPQSLSRSLSLVSFKLSIYKWTLINCILLLQIGFKPLEQCIVSSFYFKILEAMLYHCVNDYLEILSLYVEDNSFL